MESDEKINSFRDLKIWQNGLVLVREIYLITGKFPKEEIFGLTSQMRRAAVSVPSNIAEGRARGTRKDFCQFLHIAMGSLTELETQVIISKELYKHLEIGKIIEIIHEEQRMIAGMLKKLKATS